MTAVALTIAGSDSGGGAGIQADLKAFSAMGVYGASAITAITAQNTRAITAVEQVTPGMVCEQIRAVFDDLDVAAVKIGMLGGTETICAVAMALDGHKVPVVLDPVMVAKSGDALIGEEAVETLRGVLLPRATLLTPNLPEAARLLETDPARDRREVQDQARALLGFGPQAVLVKGGHGSGRVCHDLLVCADGQMASFDAPRSDTKNTHGTGCTYSAAIAAGLARGRGIVDAVEDAHRYLQGAIRAADDLGVGHGHGPVHHFHKFWGRHG
jgi:hydroxymethylpyrimidine/phosphomethylpyrimidine kinase